MIIVALLGAVVFYVVLYCIWTASSQQLDSVAAWLAMLNHMVWMPETLIFTILRGLILVVTLYVFADWVRAFTKGLKRKREARREAQEPFAVRIKTPPPTI